MKKFYLIYFFTITIFSFSQTNQQITINVDGVNRTLLLYVPNIYQSNINAPLVFNFHGYTSNATAQSDYTDFQSIADTAGFILVHPQGLDIGGGFGFNAFQNTDNSNYDYRFVEEMLTYLKQNYSIDENRIYSTGLSNGGFFSYDLACFLSEHFAAIASVAGTMISSHLSACNPSKSIPVMHIHGTNDLTVSYTGVGGILSSVSVDNLISFWVNHNQNTSTSIEENLANSSLNDLSTVSHYTYENNQNFAVVELYKVINGSHTWPGSSYPIIGLVTNQDFSASKEIWRFFSQHQKTNHLIESTTSSFSLYPNPSKNSVTIKTPSFPVQCKLKNIEGKEVQSFLLEKQTTELNFNHLKSGVYFFELNNKVFKWLKE
ncbi:MAG: T9SS type A sorting domain-containing protein [Flavobacteriia bacterium]|nr:T9SS type A sorting domain-containing protein [Flavobacteriia bacterium]